MAGPARGRRGVLHRIEMDVVEVPRKIVLVAQRMLPISPLPNPALAFGGAAGGDPFAFGQSMRKAALGQAPAGGEIRVAIGQGPCRVQINNARRRSARLTVKK